MLGDLLVLYLIVGFIWVWKGKNTGALVWIAKISALGLSVLFDYLTLPWGFYISIYLRYIIVAFYIFTVIITFLRLKKKPLYTPKHYSRIISYFICIVIIGLSIYNITLFVKGYFSEDAPVKLSFPFKNGVYLVYWGGNGKASPSINYHYNYIGTNSVQYATDICKLNVFGIREKGLRSRKLENYAIFNETIYSPCDGQVVESIDILSDIEPLSQPSLYSNYIIIKMNNTVFIRLEHLKEGSIMVKTGDTVKSGQAIAKVGNSGMTDVPHLHIQAMTSEDFYSAEALPIVFDGKYPVRNSLFLE